MSTAQQHVQPDFQTWDGFTHMFLGVNKYREMGAPPARPYFYAKVAAPDSLCYSTATYGNEYFAS
jgi:hypothetical protein